MEVCVAVGVVVVECAFVDDETIVVCVSYQATVADEAFVEEGAFIDDGAVVSNLIIVFEFTFVVDGTVVDDEAIIAVITVRDYVVECAFDV